MILNRLGETWKSLIVMTIIGYQVVKTEVTDNSKEETSSEIGNTGILIIVLTCAFQEQNKSTWNVL